MNRKTKSKSIESATPEKSIAEMISVESDPARLKAYCNAAIDDSTSTAILNRIASEKKGELFNVLREAMVIHIAGLKSPIKPGQKNPEILRQLCESSYYSTAHNQAVADRISKTTSNAESTTTLTKDDQEILEILCKEQSEINRGSDSFYRAAQQAIDLIQQATTISAEDQSTQKTTVYDMHKSLANVRNSETQTPESKQSFRNYAKTTMKKIIENNIINNPNIPETSALKIVGRSAFNIVAVIIPVIGWAMGYKNWRDTGNYFFKLKTDEEIKGTEFKNKVEKLITTLDVITHRSR